MSSLWAFALYGIVFALALGLVYWRHTSWYWHVLSIAVAIGVGLYRAPESWRGPWLDIAIGCLFVFFFFWGVGEVVFHTVGRHRIAQRT